MTRKLWKVRSKTASTAAVVVGVIVGLLAVDAAAWGPRAQRAVTGTAIQMIRRTYPNAFKADENNYEGDVLAGALLGPEKLNHDEVYTGEEQTLTTIDNEIRLLREVRKFGLGSYFSCRMGMLGSLVADLMLPYSLDYSAADVELKSQIESDIDQHLEHYGFSSSALKRTYVRTAREYFIGRRTFYDDNKRMIADDYTRGKGYQGYLKEAGPAFFCRAVESVADVWNTVLYAPTMATDVSPSAEILTEYLVQEIQYLLVEKRNLYQAFKTYASFEKVNPGIAEAYEKVADLFYAYGTEEARERGVREWRIAYEQQGPNRRHVAKKLAEHYIQIGDALLAKSRNRRAASDEDLPNALHAFNQAIEIDLGNEMAAARINETNAAIADRKERRDLNVSQIASADKKRVEAEKSRQAGDYGNAIATYTQAAALYRGVDDEFSDQLATAKESIGEAENNIRDIIDQVFDEAELAVTNGDRFKGDRKYDEAVKSYERVPSIVSVIPGDESTIHGKDKAAVIKTAADKIDAAKTAQQRDREEEARRAEKARQVAAGGGAN